MSNDPVEARQARRASVLKFVADSRRTPSVRVLPRDAGMRKALAHPTGNLKFPQEGGSVEWPLDSFTKRRLQDGTVTREEAPDEPPAAA